MDTREDMGGNDRTDNSRFNLLKLTGKGLAGLGLTLPRCHVCGTISRKGLCPNCAEELTPRVGGYCPGCGSMYGLESYEPTRCPDCRTNPPPWSRLTFHSRYEGLMRSLIINYKFGMNLNLCGLLGKLALSTIEERGTIVPDVIIPVPLHPKRLLWRGFNQSLEISRPLSRKCKRPILHGALTRIVNTAPQSTLSGTSRRDNLKGAFRAETDLIKGKTVLLVDDVLTTGTTITECTRTLARAGAASVEVLILARSFVD